MKQSKMPADLNRRAKATVDAIDAILTLKLNYYPGAAAIDAEPSGSDNESGTYGGSR